METKFIVEPGGLRDLADALTERYDPIVGEDALQRLSDFLTVRVPGRRDDRGKTVPELVGERRYRDAVHQLWPLLIADAFEEPAPAPGFGDGDLCMASGMSIPFPPTPEERARRQDPRKAISERYASEADYVRAVSRAARQLVDQRLLLPKDAEAIVATAGTQFRQAMGHE